MLNRLRRQTNRDPWPSMAQETAPMRGAVEPDSVPADDYAVEGDRTFERPTATGRVVHALQIVLIVLVAVLSFAMFWLIGLMLNLF